MTESPMTTRQLNGRVALFTSTRLVLTSVVRMVYPFLAIFASNLHVDISRISLAIAFSFIASAAAPFLAPIADRRGRKTGMLLGISIVLTGTFLAGLIPSYSTLFLVIMLGNLGNNLYLPAMQAYVGDHVPYQKRGLYLAITELSWALSFVLIIPLAGWIIEVSNWYTPFILVGILGLVMMFLLWRNLPADHPEEPPAGNLFSDFKRIFTYAPAILSLAFGVAICAANEVVNVVFGVWIQTSYGVEIAALGAATLLIGLSEVTGEGLTAYLADHLGKKRSVALGLVLNAAVCLSLPFFSRSLTGAFIWLFLFYMTFELAIISSLPLMTEVYPQARATMMALLIAAFSLGRALGDLISPGLFKHGINFNGIAAVGFNILALVMLSLVHLPAEEAARQAEQVPTDHNQL
jgi:predicted MFS family arabinose efflux permease